MASPPAPTASDDWTAQVADTIESVVGSVRSKTTVPIETIARGVVYGLVIVVLATVALVLASIGLMRVLENWLRVWGAYLVVGGLFTALGLLCWAFRRPRKRG